MIKRKKGQYYIFVAILLCISTFSIISTVKMPKQKDLGLETLYDNYITEADNVINHALYLDLNVYDEFDKYTTNFIGYSKTKNTELRIMYMLVKDDNLRIVNYLNEDINITSHNKTLKNNERTDIAKLENVTIIYKDNPYNYQFTNDSIQFKALLEKEVK